MVWVYPFLPSMGAGRDRPPAAHHRQRPGRQPYRYRIQVGEQSVSRRVTAPRPTVFARRFPRRLGGGKLVEVSGATQKFLPVASGPGEPRPHGPGPLGVLVDQQQRPEPIRAPDGVGADQGGAIRDGGMARAGSTRCGWSAAPTHCRASNRAPW